MKKMIEVGGILGNYHKSSEVQEIVDLSNYVKESLKKQAEDIKGWMKFFGIELTEGQERDYKQRFLKQEGGKGTQPK